MKYNYLLVLIAIIINSSCQKPTKEALHKDKVKSEEISYRTSDGILIFGNLYAIDKKAPTILLFHQGGSNARGEYSEIIPNLLEADFNILAIDQRLGGEQYGSINRTLDSLALDDFEYCDAYPDLVGALDYIKNNGFKGKKILWGSSYSASLAIKLATQRQDEIAGVLAFSPASGGPMKACRPDIFFESLKIPLLILRPSSELERESSKDQFKLAIKSGHQVYEAKNGKHGSSMLVEKRVGASVDDNWKKVHLFLEKLK